MTYINASLWCKVRLRVNQITEKLLVLSIPGLIVRQFGDPTLVISDCQTPSITRLGPNLTVLDSN